MSKAESYKAQALTTETQGDIDIQPQPQGYFIWVEEKEAFHTSHKASKDSSSWWTLIYYIENSCTIKMFGMLP